MTKFIQTIQISQKFQFQRNGVFLLLVFWKPLLTKVIWPALVHHFNWSQIYPISWSTFKSLMGAEGNQDPMAADPASSRKIICQLWIFFYWGDPVNTSVWLGFYPLQLIGCETIELILDLLKGICIYTCTWVCVCIYKNEWPICLVPFHVLYLVKIRRRLF